MTAIPAAPVPATAAAAPHRGIANIGNTCYLNSAIQALRYTPAFARYFCSDTWKSHSDDRRKGAELTKETATIVADLCSSTDARTLIPGKFVRSFVAAASEINDEIHYGAQADVAEAVHILLDMLHTHLSREVLMNIRGEARSPAATEYVKSLESWATFFHKEYSPLLDMFYGQTRTRVVCERCAASSDRYEPWNVLSLPIPGADRAGAPAPTLQECIAARFAEEKLDDYECSRCSDKVPAKIEHTMSRFPQYLIVSLKRFTNAGSKVRARIPYDESMVDLSTWRSWTGLQSPADAHYRVYATIEHLGSSRMGHYIMRARDGDGWLVYDDASVHPSPIGGAAGPDTYVLFLEKKGSALPHTK